MGRGVAGGRRGVGTHGLRRGGEGLDRVHHGLGRHHASLREGDGERHLHDPVRDGDDGASLVHDGGHCSRVGNVHLHSVL